MKWLKYDIRELSDEEYEKWYSLMSEDKQQRVDRFRFMDDKKRTIVGEMLARKAIVEWCHVSEENIQFGKSEYGKPFAIGFDVEFNISHSGDIVVCAVDKKPIGIDIEHIRPIDLNVAKHICTEEELHYIFGYKPSEKAFHQTNDNQILTRFFEIWTWKEAYGKMVGVGMMDRCNMNLSGKCNVTKFILDDNYVVTICARE